MITKTDAERAAFEFLMEDLEIPEDDQEYCSGIGADYDDDTQEFLGTDQDILYVLAIGL